MIPGLGSSPEKKIATHSSILAWKIPWAKEPGRLQPMGSQRVRCDLVIDRVNEHLEKECRLLHLPEEQQNERRGNIFVTPGIHPKGRLKYLGTEVKEEMKLTSFA